MEGVCNSRKYPPLTRLQVHHKGTSRPINSHHRVLPRDAQVLQDYITGRHTAKQHPLSPTHRSQAKLPKRALWLGHLGRSDVQKATFSNGMHGYKSLCVTTWAAAWMTAYILCEQ